MSKDDNAPVLHETGNFYDVADHYRDWEMNYEKSMFTGLLIGSGAAVTILVNFLFNGAVPDYLINYIIPSIWMFVLSLISTFISGVYYIHFLQSVKVSQRCRGNAQSQNHMLIECLKLGVHNERLKELNIDLNEYKMRKEIYVSEANQSENDSKKFAKLTKWFICIGLSLFAIGILIPLFIISLSSSFVGLK